MLGRLFILVILLTTYVSIHAQDSSKTTIQQIPVQYLDMVSSKAGQLEQKLDAKSEKTLRQLQQQEAKMRQKLSKIDSVAANSIFGKANEQYKQLTEKLKTPGKLTQYIPQLDSIGTALNFLKQNPQLLSQAKEVKDKLKTAISKVDALKGQLQKAEDIKKFLKERKQFLKEQLSKFGFAKELKKLNKQVYYYSQQLAEYKTILKDPKKIEKKALEILSKTKLFKDFMAKNSMLASLFPMPGASSNGQTAQTGLAGLQTRSQVLSFIQEQSGMNNATGANFASVLQNKIQSAQGIVDQLRNKLHSTGGGNDFETPDFKPNNQKTKSLKKRLEIGTNLQSQKSNYFFPATTDLGISIGYKLNDKSIIGIGTSGKIGWGKNIQHIKLSGEGVSIRSFLDLKIKGGFYASGGFEYNYQQSFDDVRRLYNPSDWKSSALIGVMKTVAFKSKFFKKTKIQLLYDFLAREQLPVTQPLKFRIGYVF